MSITHIRPRLPWSGRTRRTLGRGRDPHRRPRRPRTVATALLVTVAVIVPLTLPALCRAQGDEVSALRRQIEQMRVEYERRIRALESRIETLEASRPATGHAHRINPRVDELEALRKAARQAARAELRSSSAGPTKSSESLLGTNGAVNTAPNGLGRDLAMAAPVGHERNLNRLNPEISFTGDVVARAEGAAKTFDAREFELDMQAALDPFSSTKWTVSFGTNDVEIEEGYIKYTGLVHGITMRAGKMRQTFGALNRFHQHALPQVDYPLVLRTFFDADGLAQTGASVEWLLPRPWASANELTVQITDGASTPFGGGTLERPALLAHLSNYWDLSPSTYLEWGLSGIGGRESTTHDTRIWGSDLTVHWQPPSRAKYREITWRTEALLSQRKDTTDRRRDAWGGYSYVESLLRRNLYAGLRCDIVEAPLDPSAEQWRLGPYVTWWQSEYVRLRGMYQFVHDDAVHDTDHRLVLQLTWAAGPHKHENY